VRSSAGPHDHDPLDALAAGEELGLGDDRAAAARLAALATTLLLGLQAGRGAGGVVDGVIGIGIGQDVSVGGADLDVVCLRLVGRDQGVLGFSVSGGNRKRGSSARPGGTTPRGDDDRCLEEQSEARHCGRPGCFLRCLRLGCGLGCLLVEGRVAGLGDRRRCRGHSSGRCGGLARSPLARGPGRGSGRSGPARDLVS
jgi:hypothetical protein